MKTEIDPQNTTRANAFKLWANSPMPMVTLTKTYNIGKLLGKSKRRNLKFNMLMSWCIGKAASSIQEFYYLPEKGKLFKYDKIAINVIINNINGGINSFDLPYLDDITKFSEQYNSLSKEVYETCESNFLEDYMIIGTSAMIDTELDNIVNQYCDTFPNPMVMWGKYRKKLFSTTLPISFQFHHLQMDGKQAIEFLNNLQTIIKK